ncbi:MAG: glycosyltransferase family 4 protein [Youngiibacter sp.]|nr:glycosyltransferase family 4 protein [Youngiibacter sp.]
MKVLFINTSNDGHHLYYLKALSESRSYDSIAIVPDLSNLVGCKQIVINNPNPLTRKLAEHMSLMNEYYKIAKQEKPDVVHFLVGDVYNRFFGFGIHKFRHFKTVITFHHFKRTTLRDLSLRIIMGFVNIAIVHTSSIKNGFNSIGIKNVRKVEYPSFSSPMNLSVLECRKRLGVEQYANILLCIGNTRYEKGLDILLDSLKKVKTDFHLIIAGKEEAFTRDLIENKIESFSDKVTLKLDYLTDDDFSMFMGACDYVVLPYRMSFDGASGPLAEGVLLRKPIIGPSHGSLGEIIVHNHLGLTFEAENTDDLANKIEFALKNGIMWDQISEKYRDSLNANSFINDHNDIYNTLLSN